MKINDILNKPSKKIDSSINDKNRIKNKSSITFKEALRSNDISNNKEYLRLLLEKIDVQAERLSKNIDIREVIAYKKLISEFLKETVDSMVKFNKDNFLDRRGRHKIYAIIKKVDGELEKLTEDVLKKEKDNIKILKRLDDIRGLILDIYM